jgi:hypothetical protein
MAGKIPSFVTGATAKIKAGGLTMAYAQDVNYRVSVDTIPVETMGRYEAVTNEPVNYSVSGDLAIVRYTKVAQTNGMPGAVAGGNGLGNMNWKTGGKGSDMFDPGNLLISQTFDLAVYQKQQTGAASAGASNTTDTQMVISITDCRLTNKGAGLNKRGILVDHFAFVGILASDDSFTASNSGDEDLSA